MHAMLTYINVVVWYRYSFNGDRCKLRFTLCNPVNQIEYHVAEY